MGQGTGERGRERLLSRAGWSQCLYDMDQLEWCSLLDRYPNLNT
jgi:hypothetical protein